MLGYAVAFLALLGPHSALYVKGHSRAAVRARERLEAFTCYHLVGVLEDSAAILHVDHLLSRSGRPYVVMVLENSQGKLLWEGKAEDNPWPLPSPVDRLLRRLGRFGCRDNSMQPAKKKRPASRD